MRFNHRGYSLVSVLSAIAILSILIVSLSKFFVSALGNQKHVEFKYDMVFFHNEIYALLSDPKICLNTFTSLTTFVDDNGTIGVINDDTAMPSSTVAPTRIKDANGNDVYKIYSVANDIYDGGRIKIISIKLSSYAPYSSSSPYSGRATVNITYEKAIKSPGVSHFSKDLKVDMKIESNSGNANYRMLAGCSAYGNTTGENFWKQTVSLNGIFYASGYVGIGTSVPSTELEVNGNISTNTLTYTSDQSLKAKVKNLINLKNKTLQLRPVSYYWNEKAKLYMDKKSETRQIGLIAQEVEKIFPEVVHTNSLGIKTIDYPLLTVPLIETLKEQNDEIYKLNLEVQDLNQRLNLLEKRLGAK